MLIELRYNMKKWQSVGIVPTVLVRPLWNKLACQFMFYLIVQPVRLFADGIVLRICLFWKV
jgi:hypothetical protein